MKIRMLKTKAGPDGVFHLGTLYDVPEEEAREMQVQAMQDQVDFVIFQQQLAEHNVKKMLSWLIPVGGSALAYYFVTS